MRLALTVTVLAATALLTSCGGTPREASAPATAAGSGGASGPVPVWLSTPPTAPGMLYGVGAVNLPHQRDKAIAQARVDLAAQIEVSINAERQQDDREVTTQVQGGAITGRMDSESRSAVRTKVTAEALPGLKVEEVYEGASRTAALVSLDRRQWAEDLRTKLKDLDAELVHRREAQNAAGADAKASPIPAAIRTYRALLPTGEERAEAARRLRIASPTESVPKPAVDVLALRADLVRQMGSLRIAMVGSDATAISIIPQIYDSCAAIGLKAVSHTAPSELRLQLSAHVTTALINGETRADGQLECKLVQVSGDHRLAGFVVTSRASGMVSSQAQERARVALVEQLREQIELHLMEWLEGL